MRDKAMVDFDRLSDNRQTWQDHILAAIRQLRNQDRSVFEQRVYDALRIFAAEHLEK